MLIREVSLHVVGDPELNW